MAIQAITLKNSMSKNIQAIMPLEEEKKVFEKHLIDYLTNLRLKFNESEEHQKGLLIKFLNNAVFKNANFINTNERADLAIFNGANADSSVGILIELKSTTNKNEMISTEDLNKKAFQEVLSYYMRERIVNGNIEIKKCIITNGLSWFVIDSTELEKHFMKNKKLIREFNLWRTKQTSGTRTEFLYENICKPAIDEAIEKGIKVAHFNLIDAIKNEKSKLIELKKNNLTQLYRFFTPENLLKKEIFIDSNKLNKNFYDELLYLMGLEEAKVTNKKIIRRLQVNDRQQGSFVENVINRLVIKDVPEEEAYDIAIQLSVIWVNRILFLKLLESQLVLFNNNDFSYRFLTKEQLPTFEDLWDLFFGVLAKRPDKRPDNLKDKYKKIPYLNSSLFEEYDLERKHIGVDNLREDSIKIFNRTILKGENNKRIVGNIDFLTYLFEFLNAYDFSTAVRHQKDISNNLINASVLGLIFEKINGYKEGSFYTPGKITMYMSRKSVRKVVIDKFNEQNNWQATTLDDIKFNIRSLNDAKNANDVIDTLKICDPAVGSGHFLVSVLNELLAVKSELGILLDFEGKSLNALQCTVVNDELIVQDLNGDNFIYKVNNPEYFRIQKSLFNEKKKLIESSLFGVDINPNSVNICRLRLWIELLKNSYYEFNEDTQQNELITLPNIDINIKTGNSLLYNIPLETYIEDKRAKFFKFDEYYQLVSEYKKSNDKALKKDLTEKIEKIKLILRTSFDTPERKEVVKLRTQLIKLNQLSLFEDKEQNNKRKLKIKQVERKLKESEKKREESEKNPMWKHALEWRMEFPEILDENGVYVGFDLIIANPPYIYSSNEVFSKEEKKYFEEKYPLNKYQANTFGLFLELSFQLLRKGGTVSVIIPNSFLTVKQYHAMRRFLISETGDLFILNSRDKIFEDASIDNCIINSTYKDCTQITVAELSKGEINIINEVSPVVFHDSSVINISSSKNGSDVKVTEILNKIGKNSKPLQPTYGIVKVGVKLYKRGQGTPKQEMNKEIFTEWKNTSPFESATQLNQNYLPYLGGRDVLRYSLVPINRYVKYGEHIAEPRNLSIFSGERVIIREISSQLPYAINSTFLTETAINNQSAKTVVNLSVDGRFIVGVLNSKIVTFWAVMKYDMLQRNTFPRFTTDQMRNFPIPNCSELNKQELSNMVQSMLDLHVSMDKELQLKEINKLNEKIDIYVMKLFGLNEEEILYINDIDSINPN